MHVTCEYEHAVWTAAEVEELTGVSPLTQRAWRNRNFLGPRTQARGLTSIEVAQIAALRAMRQQGVDLEMAAPTAQRSASVLWFAVNLDPIKLIGAIGSRVEMQAFEAALANTVERATGDWPFLRAALGMDDGGVKRFIVSTVGVQDALASVDEAFEDEELEAAVVVDLLAIGNNLAKRSTKPLLYARNVRVIDDGGPDTNFASAFASTGIMLQVS